MLNNMQFSSEADLGKSRVGKGGMDSKVRHEAGSRNIHILRAEG